MPGLNFGDAPTWLQWLIAVAAVVAFIAGAVRAIPPAWRFISQFVTTVNSLAGLPAELTKQDEFRASTVAALAAQDQKIAEIHHETHNNDGSSVKDSVDRIELGVRGFYDETAELKTSLAGVHGRLDDVDRKVSDLTSAEEELRENASELRRDFENTHPRTTLKLPKEKP